MKQCTILGCTNKHQGRGYCSTHYERWWQHGDATKTMRPRHGLTKTRAYSTWECMKQRCYNHKHRGYKNYGGRGITICDRWRYSFENFYADMGERPTGLSIERINNDGNYEPGNCKWATVSEQNYNRRKTVG